jgi:hypothetical protein
MRLKLSNELTIDLFLPRAECADCSITFNQLLVGRSSVDSELLKSGGHLLFQATNSLHDELIQVIVRYREKFDALEQGISAVFGLVQDALIEIEPGKLAVQIQVGGL